MAKHLTRAGIAAIALTIVATALAVAPAGAAHAAPTLRAKYSKTTITRTWTVANTGAAGRLVEVERAVGDGAFAAFATKQNAGTRGTVKDKDLPARFMSYRARVTEGGTTSSWSELRVDTFQPLSTGISDCPPDYTARALVAWNAWRAANGVDASQRAPIGGHMSLARLARVRAARLAQIPRLTHAGFSLGLLAQWGYPLPLSGGAGENAAGGWDPEGVIDAWASSPGHRANQIRRTRDGALGCAINEHGEMAWVMLVGAFILTPG